MKIKLLNDGGYAGMGDVKFPVEVEAMKDGELYQVNQDEIIRVGGDSEMFDGFDNPYWPFHKSDVEAE